MTVSLHVLHVPDCPNVPVLLERLREASDLPVATREITTDADAAALGMAGSPTLLVNGIDPFTTPGQGDPGLSCRLYRDERGHVVPAPSVAQLRGALATADSPTSGPPPPGDVLSTGRTSAIPLDPAEKALHRAILRTFAGTGRPPAPGDLDPASAGSGRSTADLLAALHDLDAIRLTPDGQIAVAYPFSATPTRHRVRIGDRTDVFAMCAIDAVGMSAMLGEDTRIDSTDVTTGQPITVAMIAGHTRWDPPGAVVFVGADAGGGPSADSCCDYLNFFADEAAATAWTTTHPQIPGRVLTQAEAEDLGTRLFGPLLATG